MGEPKETCVRSKPRFPLGRVVATPGALAALEASGERPERFLGWHVRGDWGEIPDEDCQENELSLREGYRVLPSYRTRLGTRLWVITEADRSSTCLLLPEEC